MRDQTLATTAKSAAVEPSRAPAGASPIGDAPPPGARARRLRQRVLFWVRRYLPAEIISTASVLLIGTATFEWSTSVPLTAIVAIVVESLAFYAVFAAANYREQRRRRPTRRHALSRSLCLLAAEFGPAELIDSLLVRPWAFGVALWAIPNAGWALFAGKVAADVIFYVAAAGGFRITTWSGLRGSDEHR